MHKFLVKGVVLQPYEWPDVSKTMPLGQMKSQARKASHAVPGADDQVGPVIRFERYGKIIKRALTRRELVFGVKTPDDGEGGFAGLVIWHDPSGNEPGEIIIRGRAGLNNASDWIVNFVRQIILEAGWTIQKEIKN